MGDYEPFVGKDKQAVIELVNAYGNPTNMEDQQNSSPTLAKLLELEKIYGKDITYEGYIIKKPRDDFRVSVDGFTIKNISADEILMLMRRCPNADECQWDRNLDDSYNVRFWWD